MKTISMVVSAVSFVVVAAVTLLIVRALRSDLTFLHLALGAIVGTQAGVFMHHRSPGASWTAGTKLQLGIVTAVTCVLFELVVQGLFHWDPYPEVTIPIGAVGSFIFPFAISNSFWKVLEKAKKKSGG